MIKTDAVARFSAEQSQKQENRLREAKRVDALSQIVVESEAAPQQETKQDPVTDVSSGTDDDTDDSPTSDDTDSDDDTDD